MNIIIIQTERLDDKYFISLKVPAALKDAVIEIINSDSRTFKPIEIKCVIESPAVSIRSRYTSTASQSPRLLRKATYVGSFASTAAESESNTARSSISEPSDYTIDLTETGLEREQMFSMFSDEFMKDNDVLLKFNHTALDSLEYEQKLIAERKARSDFHVAIYGNRRQIAVTFPKDIEKNKIYSLIGDLTKQDLPAGYVIANPGSIRIRDNVATFLLSQQIPLHDVSRVYLSIYEILDDCSFQFDKVFAQYHRHLEQQDKERKARAAEFNPGEHENSFIPASNPKARKVRCTIM